MACSLLGGTSKPSATAADPKVSTAGYTEASAHRTCTLGGAVNARCMEVHGFPSSAAANAGPRKEEHRQWIVACFRGLSEMIKPDKQLYNVDELGEAGSLAYSADESSELAADPAAQECIGIADRYTRGMYMRRVRWRAEIKRIEETFPQAFDAVCKTSGARIYGDQWSGLPIVELPTKPKRKNPKVAMTGTKPSYQVLCTGEIVEELSDGKRFTKQPSFLDVEREGQRADCLHSCEMADRNMDVCGSAGMAGAARTAPACTRWCKNECGSD